MEIVENKGPGITAPKPTDISIDEALAMAKFGICNVVLMLVSGTILAAYLLEIFGIGYIISFIGHDMKITTKEKGILSAIGFAGVIVSSHMWGFLADTYGRRKIMIPTLFITFTISLISSFLANFWVIVFMRFMVGVFIAGPSSASYAYLNEFHDRKNGFRAIMGASIVFAAGSIILPGLAYIVISQEWELPIPLLGMVYRPYRMYFIVCSLPGLVCALILLKLPESPKFSFSQGESNRAIEAIHWMHRINTFGKKTVPLRFDSLRESQEDQMERERRILLKNTRGFLAFIRMVWNQTVPLFMSPHLRKTTVICILQFVSYMVSQGMFMFFPEIVNQMVAVDETGIRKATMCQLLKHYGTLAMAAEESNEAIQTMKPSGLRLSIALGSIYAVGFAVIATTINFFGRLPLLVFVFVTCGMAGQLLFFVDSSAVVMCIYTVFLCSGYTAIMMSAIITDLYPTNLRTMAVCISLMIGRLGSAFGSNLLGILLEKHCELTFGVASLLLIACGIISFFVPSIDQRDQSKIPTEVQSPNITE
ncbi:synaptic vesicle glycoprotein 2B-like [Armigeres subalbatus]|uniref:synaptic vesicle glycoprotein 2B-like n=1 Tax=Armigeres subalbatus TaxID=124917 RepID=UPI002ED19131